MSICVENVSANSSKFPVKILTTPPGTSEEFNTSANEIAVNGPRTVYLRVVTPTGVVMGNAASGSGKFIDPEKKNEVMFSSKKEFTYTGSQQDDIHLEYEEPNVKTFPEGEYTIEIYIDKMLASQTKVALK